MQGDLLERYRQIRKLKTGITREKLILINGEEEGNIKWDTYCRKQAETNTFDYKNKKYGMTKEEFDQYNKNRSCTKENFILRYGTDEGVRRWDDYCSKQAVAGCTIEYFIGKYGEQIGTEIYRDVNFRKGHSIESYILKYGETKGCLLYEQYMDKFSEIVSVSKTSQRLFNSIYEILKSMNVDFGNIYYNDLNKEFGKLDIERKRYYFYDFVSTRANIVVEYNGDIYHANPEIYLAEDIPPFRGNTRTTREIWQYDTEKQDFIRALGFDVIIVWESKFLKDEIYYAESIANSIRSKL